MPANVTLQCQYNRPAGNLEVRYVVTNGSDRPIYVFAPLSEYRGDEAVPAPGRVYAVLSSDGVLTLSKQLWRVPDNVDIYMPEVPFLTRVEPRGRFEENLRLPLPLSLNEPYMTSADDPRHAPKPKRREAAHVVLAIGYVVEDSRLGLQPARGALFKIAYGAGISNQQVVSGERTSLRVPVLEP